MFPVIKLFLIPASLSALPTQTTEISLPTMTQSPLREHTWQLIVTELDKHFWVVALCSLVIYRRFGGAYVITLIRFHGQTSDTRSADENFG
jgi:hypothetical protein